MRDLWDRLESYLREHAPAVLATLNPPASDAQIRDAERRLARKLPPDLLASLKVHDGQRQDRMPLIPAEHDKRSRRIATWGEPASLETIVRATLVERGLFERAPEWVDSYELRGPVRRDGKWDWIDFCAPGTSDRLAVDLSPAPGGTPGQVLSVFRDNEIVVLAENYRAWFEQLVDRYEAGRYFFKEEEGAIMPYDRWDVEAED